MNTIAFSPLKKKTFSAVYTESLVKEAVWWGFIHFYWGCMDENGQFRAWCGVIAQLFVRRAAASGKCCWASVFFFFLEIGGQLFSTLLLPAFSGICRQFVLVHGCEQMCPLALLVWDVCKVVAPFLSGSGSVQMESMVLDRNGAIVCSCSSRWPHSLFSSDGWWCETYLVWPE